MLSRLTILLLAFTFFSFTQSTAQSMDQTIYQFTMDDISGNPVSLKTFEGKVVLMVNVASECGLTPQYEQLQALYEQYSEKGLVILGFPANNFGAQEPGSNETIQSFCKLNYGVTFPMFSKISVKGEDQDPLYQFLCSKDKNGVTDASVKWNFQKFLIGKNGHLLEVIEPTTLVSDEKVQNSIAQALK